MSDHSLLHLTSFQPVEGKTFIVLTDLTPEGGLTTLAADTFKYLIALNAGAIVAVPARLSTDFSTDEARKKLSQAFVNSLKEIALSDLQKVIIASFYDLGTNVLPGIFSTAVVGDSTVFVNDTFTAHPTAVALRKNWGSSVLEIQGKAFGAPHSQIWPLKNKTVLVVTDAVTETEQRLVLSTVEFLTTTGGASSVHVAVTSNGNAAVASKIAGALKVTVEKQPPVRSSSPLWSRPVSVSNLTEGSASVTSFNQSFVAAHCVVNETTNPAHDHIATTAAINFRSQAVGLLRQAALSVGSLQTSVAPLHAGQEYLRNVYPINHKRFVFLVDGSIIFGSARARTAAFDLTMQGVAQVLNNGGNVVLVPYFGKFIYVNNVRRINPEWRKWKESLGATVESNDAEQKKQLEIFGQYLEKIGAKIQEIVVFDGKKPLARSNKRSGTLCIAFSNDKLIADKILESCDVFVRDTTFFGKSVDQEGPGEDLLIRARSAFGHVAIGYAASALNIDLTPSTPIVIGASTNSIVRTILGQRAGGTPFYPTSHSYEANQMRKPIDGGQGSLLSNVVSSLATTVILHPLNLYIYPVPNPNQLPFGLGFLSLRCMHAVARDFIFHSMTRANNRPTTAPSGALAAVCSGVLSEPLRAVAYGAGRNPVNALVSTAGDPITLLTSALMNFAPQLSFELSTFLNKNLRRYVGKTKIQIGLILNAVARVIMCVVLHRVVVMRRSYPSSMLIPKSDSKVVLCAYMLKEVLALLIETFVQRYLR